MKVQQTLLKAIVVVDVFVVDVVVVVIVLNVVVVVLCHWPSQSLPRLLGGTNICHNMHARTGFQDTSSIIFSQE